MSRIIARELPPLRVPRSEPILLPLEDGRVLAAWGWFVDRDDGYREKKLSTVEILSKDRKQWRRVDNIVDPSGHLTKVRGLQWNAADKTWASVSELPKALPAGTLMLPGGVRLKAGGADWKEGEPHGARETEHKRITFKPAKRPARKLTLKKARIGGVLTALPDAKVLVTGGYETYIDFSWETMEESVAEIEVINLSRSSSSLAGKLIRPRHRHGAALLPDGSVIVAGGRHDEGREEGRVELLTFA